MLRGRHGRTRKQVSGVASDYDRYVRTKACDADVVFVYDERRLTGYIFAGCGESRVWELIVKDSGDDSVHVVDARLRPCGMVRLGRVVGEYRLSEHERVSDVIPRPVQLIAAAEDPREYVEVKEFY